MDSMVLRRAVAEDVPAVCGILGEAVKRMLAEGKRQWNENYPNETHVRADLENGVGYVLEKAGEVAGYAAVVLTGEPAYDVLNGAWLSAGDYVVVHRIAVSGKLKGQGVGKVFMNEIESYARSLGIGSFRIDTNFDNFAMLGLLERMGFSYCGEIEYESGRRMAFEKII